MKTTGVVRRIDDLGRIVIPKEIRKSLRIRDGESLEIFVDKDMIALKKYSPMNDMDDLAKTMTDAVYQALNAIMIVTDRDEILACSLPFKKKYQGKNISKNLESVIIEKRELTTPYRAKLELLDGVFEEGFFIGETIYVDGDPIGEVIVFDPEKSISDTAHALAIIVAQFLEKHLEQ